MKNKKTKKILSLITIIIIFILGIIVGKITSTKKIINQSNQSETTQIVEKKVETQTIENTLTSSGEITSSGTEKLELSTSKYFNTMCVEEDDIVLAGENILEYTNGTYLTAEYDCLINTYSVPKTGNKCTSSNYIEVQNLENMQIELQINESEINKVKEDQEVEIEISAIEDKKYTGKIKSVSGVGNYSTSGTTFKAIVEFENDGNVKIGMSASSTILIEKVENCIAVPIEAVQTNNNEKYVIVVKEDGTTENVNIKTGISNDSYVQITSGLNGGEIIQMVQIVTNNSNRNSGNRGGMSFDMSQGWQIPSGMEAGAQIPSGMQPGGEIPSGMQPGGEIPSGMQKPE